MAYFPVNARSELVSLLSPGLLRLMKFSDGGVLDTSRRFQAASPALNQPAFSPTRGSGRGAAADMSRFGDGAAPAGDDEDLAHAARDSAASAKDREPSEMAGREGNHWEFTGHSMAMSPTWGRGRTSSMPAPS